MTANTQDHILQAMVAMAAANGPVDARQIAAISRIYAQVTGGSVSEDEIARTVDARRATGGGNIATTLGTAARTLDRRTKEQVLRACYLVLMADHVITSAERKKLQEIAAAMKIPEVHFGAILEDVAVWLAAQGRD